MSSSASFANPHLSSADARVTRMRARQAQPIAFVLPPDHSLDANLARLAQGDRAVFAQVFQALWPPVERLCLSLLKHEADAADAAQEALCKIFERAAQYDPLRPALAWALAIATWECRTVLRRRQRRRETDPEHAPEAATPDGEETVVLRDLITRALAALDELSDSDRETLIATFWEEAASVSGATLRKRRERALDRLKATFKRLYALD